MKKFNVDYQIATYSGTEAVYFNSSEDPDNEEIISKAKQQLRRKAGGTFPLGYQSFKVRRS